MNYLKKANLTKVFNPFLKDVKSMGEFAYLIILSTKGSTLNLILVVDPLKDKTFKMEK